MVPLPAGYLPFPPGGGTSSIKATVYEEAKMKAGITLAGIITAILVWSIVAIELYYYLRFE